MAQPFWFDQEFTKQDYTQNKLPKGDYENCRFVDCLFTKGFLDNQNFVECTFEGCDFTNTNIAHTIFNEVTFVDCKMVGVQFETCNPMVLAFQSANCTKWIFPKPISKCRNSLIQTWKMPFLTIPNWNRLIFHPPLIFPLILPSTP